MVRKIVERVSDEVLKRDLEKYRQRALELGATDAKIITSDMILIDEKVRAKCIHPLCDLYGSNVNCPPHAVDLDLMRKVVNKFRYAIFDKVEIPAEKIAGPKAREKGLFLSYSRKNSEIVGNIEADAFHDGYYLAMGFTNGACKITFCLQLECSALTPGQLCRFPLKARASMEAVGMDAYAMATKVGWDIYPIGGSTPPSEVPFGVALGLVLIY